MIGKQTLRVVESVRRIGAIDQDGNLLAAKDPRIGCLCFLSIARFDVMVTDSATLRSQKMANLISL